MPSPEVEANVEGAKNLWRYHGRTNRDLLGYLGVLLAVGGLSWLGTQLFHHPSTSAQPAPIVSKVPANYHGQNSNGVPPTFRGISATSPTTPASGHGANSNGALPAFEPVPLTP